MGRYVDRALAVVSERHDGVFSLEHAREAGADRQLRSRRLIAGDWVAVGAAGYRFRGSPLTWRGRVQAALWDAGPEALVSHGAAARLHRFPSHRENLVEVLVPRALDHACTIAVVHQSRRFSLVRRVVVGGLPVTAPAETLIHLAPRYRFGRLEWLLDELVAARLVDVAVLQGAFARLSPGCRGMRGLKALLEDRSPGPAFPLSKLERLFDRIAAEHRLPPFVREAPVPGREDRAERVDRVWRDVRIIVELDSRRWHTRVRDFDRDHRRDLEALAHGYRTARITWAMLAEDAARVCADLLNARAQAA